METQNHNNGIAFEERVKRIQQAIINSDKFLSGRNIAVGRDYHLYDPYGNRRQFDIYWEFELDGVIHRNIIECKDYKNAISIEKIDALCGKIQDFPDIKPIMATSSGFQKGALNKAKEKGIGLLIVYEGDPNPDLIWKDIDGEYILHKLFFKINFRNYEVQHVYFDIDKTWAKEHNVEAEETDAIDIDYDIENNTEKTCMSFHDYIEIIRKRCDDIINGVYKESFIDSYIINKNSGKRIKIKAIEIEFGGTNILPQEICFSPDIFAAVDSLNDNKRKVITTDGKVITISPPDKKKTKD